MADLVDQLADLSWLTVTIQVDEKDRDERPQPIPRPWLEAGPGQAATADRHQVVDPGSAEFLAFFG